MDREKLARVENNQYIVMGEGPTLFHFGPFNGYHNEASEKAKLFNAAASAWLDREVKKVVAGFKSELRAIHGPTADCTDQECSLCAFIDCPFHDALHYHHDGCPAEYVTDEEEIRRAVDAERERCAKIVDLLAWKIQIGSSDPFSQTVIDECIKNFRHNVEFTAAAIRSAPGKGKENK